MRAVHARSVGHQRAVRGRARATRKRSIFSPAGRSTTSWRAMWWICARWGRCSTRISCSSSACGCSSSVPSISPVDSGGENIYLEYNEGVVYRIKPRYNADVNGWWISDDTRYSYKPVHDENRLTIADAARSTARKIDTSFPRRLEQARAGLKRWSSARRAGQPVCDALADDGLRRSVAAGQGDPRDRSAGDADPRPGSHSRGRMKSSTTPPTASRRSPSRAKRCPTPRAFGG